MMGQVKIMGVGCSPCLAPQRRAPGMLLSWDKEEWCWPQQWAQGTPGPPVVGEVWQEGCLSIHPRACRAGEWQSGELYTQRDKPHPHPRSHPQAVTQYVVSLWRSQLRGTMKSHRQVTWVK